MSATLRHDDIAIARLRIRGPVAVHARVQRELEQASWPQAPGESWVLLRQVRVRAPLSGVTRRLLEQTRNQVANAADDNVRRYNNLNELLAHLLTDLTRGVAAQRWYWQAWSHLWALPRAQALATLMAGHLAQLPSLCARLAQMQTLPAVWQALDDRGAQQLSAEFAWRAGVRLPSEGEITAVTAENASEISPMPRAAVALWAPVLRVLPPGDPRRRLTLLIMAQEMAPLALRQAPARLFARWDAHIAQVLGAADAHWPEDSTARVLPVSIKGEMRHDVKSKSATGPEALASAADESRPSSLNVAANNPAQKHISATLLDQDAAPTLPEEAAATSDARTPPGARDDAQEVATDNGFMHAATPSSPHTIDTRPADAVASPTQPATVAPTAARQWREMPTERAFDEFHTAQGGLFYLLNFLNRGDAQTLVEAHWQELQSGWAWLYRLGQELKLDEGDTVLDFLALQCGLENTQQLAKLPPLPARAELLALAQHWYGKVDLWQPELLALNARVQYTQSHVDIYGPLSSVRLPVRLAGLDINPGWLPWLGRVVTFHYES